MGSIGPLLLQALVRGLQGLELVTERAELLLVLGHGVVPRGHPLPPVLLELLALAVKLSLEFGELLLELLGGAEGIDRRLAKR